VTSDSLALNDEYTQQPGARERLDVRYAFEDNSQEGDQVAAGQSWDQAAFQTNDLWSILARMQTLVSTSGFNELVFQGATSRTRSRALFSGTSTLRVLLLRMEQALEWSQSIWDGKEVARVLPRPSVLPRTIELMRRYRLGRKRTLDTALAATIEGSENQEVRHSQSPRLRDFSVSGIGLSRKPGLSHSDLQPTRAPTPAIAWR
jgi:hypothetical protein